MKRKLLVLNLSLMALIAGAVWRLWEQWLEGKARQEKVFRQALSSVSPPQEASLRPPQPVTAAAYAEIAQKMLFARDRNPNVVIEAAPAKPLPPLPVALGVVNFGDGPMVILSEKPSGPHRGFSPGEKIGEFTLVAANNEEIVLEWEGQQVKKKLEELIDRSASQPRAPAPEPKSQRPARTAQTTVAAPAASQSGPGTIIGGEVRACLPGDTSPPGTVRDGLRKVVSDSPFGKVCRWEPVR